MRISDWSSDVCSSDLTCAQSRGHRVPHQLSVASVDNGWPHGSKGIAVWRATLERVAAFEFGQPDGAIENEIGRASCRERVCQYVSIQVVAVSLKKKAKKRRQQ